MILDYNIFWNWKTISLCQYFLVFKPSLVKNSESTDPVKCMKTLLQIGDLQWGSRKFKILKRGSCNKFNSLIHGDLFIIFFNSSLFKKQMILKFYPYSSPFTLLIKRFLKHVHVCLLVKSWQLVTMNYSWPILRPLCTTLWHDHSVLLQMITACRVHVYWPGTFFMWP